jgi:hypothetical protein
LLALLRSDSDTTPDASLICKSQQFNKQETPTPPLSHIP